LKQHLILVHHVTDEATDEWQALTCACIKDHLFKHFTYMPT